MFLFPGINGIDDYISIPDFVMPDSFYKTQRPYLNKAKGSVTQIDSFGDAEFTDAEFYYNGIAMVLISDGSLTADQFIIFQKYCYQRGSDRSIKYGTEDFFNPDSADELVFSEKQDLEMFVAFLDQLNQYVEQMVQLAIEKSAELFSSIIDVGDLREAGVNMLDNYPTIVFEDTTYYTAFLHELCFNNPVCNRFIGLSLEEHQQIYSLYRTDEDFLELFQQVRDSFNSLDSVFESNFSEMRTPLTRLVVTRFFFKSLEDHYASVWQSEFDATTIEVDPENYVKDSFDRSSCSSTDERAVTALSYYLIKNGALDDRFLTVKKLVKKWIDEEKIGLKRQSPKGHFFSNGSPSREHAEMKKTNNVPVSDNTDAMTELESLVGLSGVKADVVELSSLVRMNQIRQQKGLPTIPVSHHLVFTGNPGTGKTTVARILAKLYKEIGVLSKGQLVEVDRSGLVAGYVGQTAIKTQEKIQEALGGILFIDEAYTLAKDGNDFGQEAIDTILKAMEDHRNDFVVIVAGYPELMERFINSNPGLRSRFNKYVHFEDYDTEELIRIFNSMAKKYHYSLDAEAQGVANRKIESMVKNKTEYFANARDIHNMFERIVSSQALRVAHSAEASDEDILIIRAIDVQ